MAIAYGSIRKRKRRVGWRERVAKKQPGLLSSQYLTEITISRVRNDQYCEQMTVPVRMQIVDERSV